jgi:hypothetical protein
MSLAGSLWTKSDEKKLARLYRKGVGDAEIARKLMRTERAIKYKRQQLGLVQAVQLWQGRGPSPRKPTPARRYRNRPDPSPNLDLLRAENDARQRAARARHHSNWTPGEPAEW